MNRYRKIARKIVTLPKHVVPDWIYFARGFWHLGNFCNIFLPNISEDQKILLSKRGSLALYHMANTALVVALHS